MATSVIMPALEMAQETGKLLRWLKQSGEPVAKGEPIMEVETDKVTVEIPAPDSGILGGVLIKEGEEVPVGRTIAWLLAPGEAPPAPAPETPSGRTSRAAATEAPSKLPAVKPGLEASPLARKVAEEHSVNLEEVKSNGRRIEKADVLAYLHEQEQAVNEGAPAGGRLLPASPKARRLAAERGIALVNLQGSGPEGAVLAADVPEQAADSQRQADVEPLGTVWRVMAERMSASWSAVPHFYLVREVEAGSLLEWRERILPVVEARSGIKPTITDLLVKLAGTALREHPRVNAAWAEGGIRFNKEIHVGLAVAIEEGLIVPVIRNADTASITEIAVQRQDLAERANSRKLHPEDIAGGTFTLSNLGMYNVDAFSAIINAPQAAILAVGRIQQRVVPVNGQPAVRPMLVMTLSCDHRVVDGARGAKFLDDLATLIGDPWRLLA
jgi:pyruvate dehydrogenase E2 component (dihydrolipoamide acetyltransferase)